VTVLGVIVKPRALIKVKYGKGKSWTVLTVLIEKHSTALPALEVIHFDF